MRPRAVAASQPLTAAPSQPRTAAAGASHLSATDAVATPDAPRGQPSAPHATSPTAESCHLGVQARAAVATRLPCGRAVCATSGRALDRVDLHRVQTCTHMRPAPGRDLRPDETCTRRLGPCARRPTDPSVIYTRARAARSALGRRDARPTGETHARRARRTLGQRDTYAAARHALGQRDVRSVIQPGAETSSGQSMLLQARR